MKTIEKTDDEKYRDWLSENEVFLKRFISEYLESRLYDMVSFTVARNKTIDRDYIADGYNKMRYDYRIKVL